MDQMRRLITTWDKIHEIIDEAMRSLQKGCKDG